VWRNSKLFCHWKKFFSPRQYLLGDSAFTASDIMVPPLKSSPGSELWSNKTQFNTLLAKPGVKPEHCIGLLKGRSPFLKGIRILLGNKLHMDQIIDHVRGAVILHNFLLKDPIEAEWVEHKGNDDLEPEALKNKLNDLDPQRRNELLYYLSELA
jgi:DDE superfamily endonuclease